MGGGQVLGQALSAATQTVDPARLVHSLHGYFLHGYFLRPGDPHRPVLYQVDTVRDGGSLYDRRGRLVASTVQEGLTRLRD